MGKPTNEQLYSEIKLVKQDVCHVRDNQVRMQEDLTMIKKQLLSPDDGAIARINKNTRFRKSSGKALWTIYAVIIGILGKLIFWN